MDSSLQDRAIKATNSMMFLIKTMYNDSSIGLYRVQEHITKRVPYIVQERKGMGEFNTIVNISIADVEDARNSLKEYSELTAPDETIRLLQIAKQLVQTRQLRTQQKISNLL